MQMANLLSEFIVNWPLGTRQNCHLRSNMSVRIEVVGMLYLYRKGQGGMNSAFPSTLEGDH